jgi:hypothetical protein
MEAVCAEHSALVVKINPLNNAGILKQVLSYAGAGEWIFYAPISKLWLECYRNVPAHQLQRQLISLEKYCVEVLPHMTLRLLVSNWHMS